MRTIVTHMSPDLDAIGAVWLVHRYFKGFDKAQVKFVPVGETLEGKEPDEDENIIHVDTGLGKYDHHQDNDDTCATRLVFEKIISEKVIAGVTKKALDRVCDVINDGDHFRDIYFANPSDDIYDFLVDSVINGAKSDGITDDKLIEFGEKMLDYVLKNMIKKVYAEEEITRGYIFDSPWGKSIAFETNNREATHLAQKQGFSLVASKSPTSGQVRIKLRPDVKKDLMDLYEKVSEVDPNASWYYHPSGHMLLNGSTKNPHMVASKLTLQKVIVLIKNI